MTNTPEVVRFFTAQHGVYDRFIQLVGYEQGLRTFFEQSALLRSNLYDRQELSTPFRQAGFPRVEFRAFPAAASHLATWGHIVEAPKTG